ncbi:MAG: O-antigen ligase family protein [Candidatus Moranbacteria bacterium]|nr:O-antigen ligase family protein [Candidatus Moranbacteria bacterium]
MKDFFSRIAGYAIFFVLPALSFAQVRFFVFGNPVYVLEAITCVSLFFFIIARFRGERDLKRVDNLLIFGFLLIFIGILLSAYLSTGIIPEELGVLKSWIVLPVVAGFLMFQLIDGKSDINAVLMSWFLSISIFSVGLLMPGPLSEITYDGRLTSIFPSPNHLSFYLLPGVLIGWYFLVLTKIGTRSVPILLMESVILLALIRTESRGAMFSLGLGTMVFFLASLFGSRAIMKCCYALLAFLAIFCGYVMFSGEYVRLSDGGVRSPLASRVMIWNASAAILEKHPIFGIGPRNFQNEYLAIQHMFPPYLEWAVPHPHNVLLSFWLSGGLLALVGFVLLLISACITINVGLSGSEVSERLIVALTSSILLSILLHGLVDDTYFRNDLSLTFWLVLALSFAAVRIGKKAATGVAV